MEIESESSEEQLEKARERVLYVRDQSLKLMLIAANRLKEEPDNYQYASEIYDCMNSFVAAQLKLNPKYGEQS